MTKISAFYDACEWNPEMNKEVEVGSEHAPAEVVLGVEGAWRLCEECSKLPEFEVYKIRKPIQGKEIKNE